MLLFTWKRKLGFIPPTCFGLNKESSPSCSHITHLNIPPYSKYGTACATRLEDTEREGEGHRISTNKFTDRKSAQRVVSNPSKDKSWVKENCLHWTGIQSQTHLPRFYHLQNGNNTPATSARWWKWARWGWQYVSTSLHFCPTSCLNTKHCPDIPSWSRQHFCWSPIELGNAKTLQTKSIKCFQISGNIFLLACS